MSLLETATITGAVAGLTVAAIVIGGLFVVARRTFYAILLLAMIGAIVAAEMAFMGFTYLAVFHVVMYIGATVTFLLITMASIGEEIGETSISHKGWAILAALIASLLLGLPATVIATRGVKLLPEQAWIDAARFVFLDQPIVIIVVVLTIVSILVEVVAVARRR